MLLREEAARQTAVDLREHHSSVGIKFLRKLPIDDKGKGVKRPVARGRRRCGGAVAGAPKVGWS